LGCTDGAGPYAALIQATDGSFHGTTNLGGAYDYGTVFKLTPVGKLITLHSFDHTDGAFPYDGLTQATDGNFYGTTSQGGAYSGGTIFKIKPEGELTTLHSFGNTDGASPNQLMKATNGNFYGTTSFGGAYGDGTVFSLSVGLGPFVETRPTSGTVGAKIIILGNNLTDAASVTFNGKTATYTVVSSTEITTTVPSGATTGKVKVKTPSRTLISNVNFRVTPTISSFSPTSGRVGTSVVITGESFTGGYDCDFRRS
jgi:uncharacterized repeat protein (TIGR03803 family)